MGRIVANVHEDGIAMVARMFRNVESVKLENTKTQRVLLPVFRASQEAFRLRLVNQHALCALRDSLCELKLQNRVHLADQTRPQKIRPARRSAIHVLKGASLLILWPVARRVVEVAIAKILIFLPRAFCVPRGFFKKTRGKICAGSALLDLLPPIMRRSSARNVPPAKQQMSELSRPLANTVVLVNIQTIQR